MEFQPQCPVTLSKPNVTPDKFDGRTPWRDYFRHFEACKIANNWGDDQAKVFLAASLRGPALKILGSKAADTSRITYRDLAVLLEKRFGPGQLAENFLLELRYRRQGPRETLQELGQAIRELSMLAYPELTEEAQDRLARTHFAEAIEDQSIREGVFRSKPATMDEAIQAALATDNFFRLEEQRSGRRQKQARAVDTDSAATISEIWRELQRIEERITKQEQPTSTEEFRRERPNSYRRKTPKATDECYRCHEKGHFKRNCPQGIEYRRPSGNEVQLTQRPEGRLEEHQGSGATYNL